MQFKPLIDIAREAALKAGDAIMEVYQAGDIEVASKADRSPLTLADKAAHEVIKSLLASFEYPILSEEGRDIPYTERKSWTHFWLVDPLDGTKEFIKRNGEFTVNIAFIHAGDPVFGVVYAPVLNQLYWNEPGEGAWMIEGDEKKRLQPEKFEPQAVGLKVVASRSHLNAETEQFINHLNEPQLVSMGSSLKFMLLANGKAHVYPRFAPTMEWDTAAAQAVLEAVGGSVINQETQHPLRYNKPNLRNPYFLAQA